MMRRERAEYLTLQRSCHLITLLLGASRKFLKSAERKRPQNTLQSYFREIKPAGQVTSAKFSLHIMWLVNSDIPPKAESFGLPSFELVLRCRLTTLRSRCRLVRSNRIYPIGPCDIFCSSGRRRSTFPQSHRPLARAVSHMGTVPLHLG